MLFGIHPSKSEALEVAKRFALTAIQLFQFNPKLAQAPSLQPDPLPEQLLPKAYSLFVTPLIQPAWAQLVVLIQLLQTLLSNPSFVIIFSQSSLATRLTFTTSLLVNP